MSEIEPAQEGVVVSLAERCPRCARPVASADVACGSCGMARPEAGWGPRALAPRSALDAATAEPPPVVAEAARRPRPERAARVSVTGLYLRLLGVFVASMGLTTAAVVAGGLALLPPPPAAPAPAPAVGPVVVPSVALSVPLAPPHGAAVPDAAAVAPPEDGAMVPSPVDPAQPRGVAAPVQAVAPPRAAPVAPARPQTAAEPGEPGGAERPVIAAAPAVASELAVAQGAGSGPEAPARDEPPALAVAPPPVPVEAPTPPRADPVPAAALDGVYVGRADGAPFTMELSFRAGGRVHATLRLSGREGTVVSEVLGTYTLAPDGSADFALSDRREDGTWGYSGTIVGSTAEGLLTVDGRRRGRFQAGR